MYISSVLFIYTKIGLVGYHCPGLRFYRTFLKRPHLKRILQAAILNDCTDNAKVNQLKVNL